MNQEKIQIYLKREEFRNEIRHQRNEELFKRRRIFTNEITTDTFIQLLQNINIENSEQAYEAINSKIPQQISQSLFCSDINQDYINELLKTQKALLIESVYLLNCITAHIDNTQTLRENIHSNFISYLASMYQFLIDQIINDKDIPLIIDYINCIFYNLQLSKIELQIQDKMVVEQSIKKIIKQNLFQYFSLPGMETMLALYNKIQIEFTIETLEIIQYLLQKFKQKEIIQSTIKLILRTLSQTVKTNIKSLQSLIVFLKQQNISQIFLDLILEYPNIIIEYFKNITNYQKFIPINLLNYKQANFILVNWSKFERSALYQYLANIIPLFDLILGDILQKQQLLDEVLQVLQTKTDKVAKEAFYLICQILKEEKMQENYQFIGVANQYFLNCETIEEQKFYLELAIQNPLVLSINCNNKVKAKLDYLILVPELETLVKRIID